MSPSLSFPVSRRNVLRGAAALTATGAATVAIGQSAADANPWYTGNPTTGQATLSDWPDLSAVAKMGAVILLPHEYPKIPQIKAMNPRCKVYAYKNLIAVSRRGVGAYQPSVVTYQQVLAHPGWALHDTSGATIYWTDFGGYLQPIDVGDPQVIAASVPALIDECRTHGFDGLYLDDVLTEWDHTSSTAWSHATTAMSYPVDFTGGSVYATSRNWVVNAVPQIRAAGFEVIGNVQIGAENIWPQALQTWATYMDGINLEHFSRWGDYSSWEWPNFTGENFDRRRRQAEIIQAQGAYLCALSFGDSWDTVGQRYFRALFLLLSNGGGYSFWTPSNYDGSFDVPTALVDLGAPTSGATQLANGLWKRTFERGFVVVNPTGSAQGGSAASAGLGASTQWVTINSGDALIQSW